MFEADDFLNSSNETILDTKFNQLAEDEYDAQIGTDDNALVVKKGQSEKEGITKDWAQLIVKFDILDPSGEVEKKLGRKPSIRMDFFLDLTPDGKFDFAPQKNVRVGQLLKATNTLKPGWKMGDVKGKQLKIKVAKRKQQDGSQRSEVVMVGTGE